MVVIGSALLYASSSLGNIFLFIVAFGKLLIIYYIEICDNIHDYTYV